jgi:hypothetical protein
MLVENPDYRVHYDLEQNKVSFQGSLRLNAAPEYAPIADVLDEAGKRSVGGLVNLDLTKLEFLNSSGINMLYQFVVRMRKQGNVQIAVVGSNSVPWQQKSLGNMTRFMPGLKLTLQ